MIDVADLRRSYQQGGLDEKDTACSSNGSL